MKKRIAVAVITALVSLLVVAVCFPRQSAVWLDASTLERVRQRRVVIPGTDFPIYKWEKTTQPNQVSRFLARTARPSRKGGDQALVRIVRRSHSGLGPASAVDSLLLGVEREQLWMEWAEASPEAATALFLEVSRRLSRGDHEGAFGALLDSQPWED